MEGIINSDSAKNVENKGFKEIVGKQIKDAREKANLSREKFCDLVNERNDGKKSLMPDTLKQWERGVNQVPLDWIPALCKALNCDAGYIMGIYNERTYRMANTCENIGLKQSSVLNLKEILEENEPLRIAIYDFLDDLIDSRLLSDIAISYQRYKNNVANDENFYVVNNQGEYVALLDNNTRLLILQNDFNHFLFSNSDGSRNLMSRSYARGRRESWSMLEAAEWADQLETDLTRGK